MESLSTKFEHLSMEDKVNYSLSVRDEPVCRTFTKKDLNPIMEKQKFYLTYGNKILGAIQIVYKGFIQEINLHLFFIAARCTYEGGFTDNVASKGRLLWAYTLNYVFNIGGPNSIIYNSSIESAKGYHIKMGMTPYNESLFPAEFIPLVIPIDDNGIEENRRMLDEFNILFYKLKDVDYTNIFNILLSLPKSDRHKTPSEFGGKKRKLTKRPKVKKLIHFT